MIITAILSMFYDLMDWLVGVIPDVNLPLQIDSYVAPVANLAGYLDTFISLPILGLCITAVLIVDNWTVIVRLAIRIWELLPFN